jgi:hypothetical protein
LPSWQILCRIAQRLGVPGFDYKSAAQIQAEIETLNGAELAEAIPSLAPSDGTLFPSGHIDDHSYMGFPLGTWVPGFRVLYPEQVLKIPG